MELIKEKRTDLTFLYLKGRLDAENAKTLEDNLLRLIDDGARQLIVDCSQIEFINNAGLRALLSVAKKLTKLDGRLALHSPSPIARQIFNTTGFGLVARIYDSREEAAANVAHSGLMSSSDNLQRILGKDN
ncbi:MAG: STAS domain-containing protein [Blastocatellales bacterium]